MRPAAIAVLPVLAAAAAWGFELDLAAGTGGPFQIEAAGSIEWRRDEKVYIAEGDVSAERGDVVLKTETLSAYYRQDDAGKTRIDRIEARGGVTIRSPDGTANGSEATYDLDRSLIVMRGGDLTLETAAYRVTARDSLELHRGENYAVARGAARAVRAEESVSAETLVVRFEEAGDGKLVARRLEVFGKVEVRSGPDSVTGERGFYDTEAQTAEICGDVRLQQGPNRMAGECAEVDLAKGRSRLVAGAGRRVSGLFEPGAADTAPANGATDTAPANGATDTAPAQ